MTSKPESTGKRLQNILSARDSHDERIGHCRWGDKRQVTGSGYTNLTSQVEKFQPFEYSNVLQGTIVTSATSSIFILHPSCHPSMHLKTPFLGRMHMYLSYICFHYCSTIYLRFKITTGRNPNGLRHIKHGSVNIRTSNAHKLLWLLARYVENLQLQNCHRNSWHLCWTGGPLVTRTTAWSWQFVKGKDVNIVVAQIGEKFSPIWAITLLSLQNYSWVNTAIPYWLHSFLWKLCN